MHLLPKILIIGCLLVLVLSPACVQKQENDNNNNMEKVEVLLAKMSLEEKIGQMTQITLDLICNGEPYNVSQPLTINPEKLEEAIVKYHVGSILNVGTAAHTAEKWQEIITAIQTKAQETPNKIPVLYGIDAIHGPNYTQGSTLFPQQLALAATWNPVLAKELAEISAYETRASAIPWTFSPVLDLGKNPVWPRLWEGFGEDVLLSSTMGSAMNAGYQGENMADKYHVAACLKHFTGYGMPLTGKDRTPAWVPERMLREYYLPGFAKVIQEGAASIMINSGEMNGIPAHADKNLLTNILRDELGFEGIALTDWEDIKYLHTRHKIADSQKEAVRLAVEAGVDMSMVPVDFSFYELLLELVQEGTISEARIDQSVRRILKVKMDLGLFEKTHYPLSDYPKFGGEEFQQKSLQAAREAIILLKNENNILPLAKESKVLVTGSTATTMRSLNQGWSYSWQGERADEFTQDKLTILKALQKNLGEEQVIHQAGCSFDSIIDIQAAVSAANQCDAVILCLGETSYTEFMGNIDDLYLSDAQIELAKAMAQTGKPVILVLAEGRPRLINKFEADMNAVVLALPLGNEGGQAITDVLFGDFNPCGKLPITYPSAPNDLMNYDFRFTESAAIQGQVFGYFPQYPFGFGLSYTEYTYSDLKVSADTLAMDDDFTIEVKVKNTGSRAGKEIVQLYIGDVYASITPPIKRLRGFQSVSLEAGEEKTLSFTINSKDLAFVGLENKWIVEPGEFKVYVEQLESGFYLK